MSAQPSVLIVPRSPVLPENCAMVSLLASFPIHLLSFGQPSSGIVDGNCRSSPFPADFLLNYVTDVLAWPLTTLLGSNGWRGSGSAAPFAHRGSIAESSGLRANFLGRHEAQGRRWSAVGPSVWDDPSNPVETDSLASRAQHPCHTRWHNYPYVRKPLPTRALCASAESVR